MRDVDGLGDRPAIGRLPGRGDRTDREEDRRKAEELLADPKERAEHVMLVDLGRNDVGRVARFRSVEVTDIMAIERYSHVMHITTNVSGRLADGKDAFDALRAFLPAGIGSGGSEGAGNADHRRTRTESSRSAYAGKSAISTTAATWTLCIALRTIVVQGSKAYVQAGAGIVADSDPATEYQNPEQSPRGPLKAIRDRGPRREVTKSFRHELAERRGTGFWLNFLPDSGRSDNDGQAEKCAWTP